MSKTVFSDCFNHISVISQPFWLFLGSFENWRVGASEPVPVPATTQPINPCGSVNPRQSLITNATCDLPTVVIKELKAGFKQYIPLALCNHKACSNATRTSDAFD